MAARRRLIARSDSSPSSSSPGAASPASSSSSSSEPPLDALSTLIADAVARRADGRGITPWELPAVVACRNAIADALRQLPIVAMRGGRPRPDQPAVYRQPDPDEPRGRTLERIAYQLTGDGYCWLLITTPATDPLELAPTTRPLGGFAGAVRVLDANQAYVTERDAFGRPVTVADIAGTEHRRGESIILVANAVRSSSELGASPIGQCWRAVDYLCALYDMAGSFWEAGFPSLAMVVEHRLSKAQADELKARLAGAWARRHEPAVIDNGASLESVGSSAVESQLVESIAVANAEIARAFGVPPSLVNIASGGSLTYATTEGEKRAWIAGSLGGYLTRIEEAFSMLGPTGTDARLQTKDWARGDPMLRANYYAAGIRDGWFTPAEARDDEHLEPSADVPSSPTPSSSSAGPGSAAPSSSSNGAAA